jgi:hypothetical protein
MRYLMKPGLALVMALTLGTSIIAQERPDLPYNPGKPSMKISFSPADPTTKDQVTFTVEARDNSMTGLKRIVILVNDKEVKVCLTSPCSYFGGPYPEGPLKFEARVFDHTSSEPSTDLRVIDVTGPSGPVESRERPIDLAALAGNADTRWANGLIEIPFADEEEYINGFAVYRYDALLEDDEVYPRALVTRPGSLDESRLIVGVFRIRDIPKNATFRARIGFLKEAEQADGAEFRVFLNENPSRYAAKRCYHDGRLDDLVLDLGSFSGRDVEIVLQVRALNPAAQNLTAWIDPRIER